MHQISEAHTNSKYTLRSMPPSNFIVSLTEWTLKNNIFLFQNQLYRQEQGTAMGAAYAPSYAGLFLGQWEHKFIYSETNPFRSLY